MANDRADVVGAGAVVADDGVDVDDDVGMADDSVPYSPARRASECGGTDVYDVQFAGAVA